MKARDFKQQGTPTRRLLSVSQAILHAAHGWAKQIRGWMTDSRTRTQSNESNLFGEWLMLQERLRIVCKALYQSSSALLLFSEPGLDTSGFAQWLHVEHFGDRPFVSMHAASLQTVRVQRLLDAKRQGDAVALDASLAAEWLSADSGTLFISDLAELPPYLQMRIEQWVQQGHWFALDGTRYDPKSKLILATEAPPIALADQLTDIYFSLIQGAVRLPALRESRFQLPRLIHAAFREAAQFSDVIPKSISPSVISLLCSYGWPGNLTELRRVAHHAMLHSEPDTITLASLPSHLRVTAPDVSDVLRMPEFAPAVSEPGSRFAPSRDSDSRSS